MAKASKQGTQKQGVNAGSHTPTPHATGVNKPAAGVQAQSTSPAQTQGISQKGKQGSRNNRGRMGGTAVPGAKSTLPREATPSRNPQQQQAESYNRTMRRRMEQLGTSPTQQSSLTAQQRKRIEKRRKRTEERRQEVKKVAAGGPRNIKLGRTVVFFLVGVVALIILIIIIAVFINRFR